MRDTLTLSSLSPACPMAPPSCPAGRNDRTVRLWSLADNTCTAVLDGHWVQAVAISPDGATLASGSYNSPDRAPFASGALLMLHVPPHSAEMFVAQSAVTNGPDGASFAICSWDNTVCLWRVDDNVFTAKLRTPDGHHSGVSQPDKTVRLWRLADRTCIAVLERHREYVEALTFTPDGFRLANMGTAR